MRVNVYAEEMTDRVEVIAKEIEGQQFTGLRVYLELPATVGGQQYRGPFMHRPGDDDSSAVTFWGKRDLRTVLQRAITKLDEHYAGRVTPASEAPIEGVRVGRTLHDGELCELILLPGDFKGTWSKATAWAADQGGILPSRIDQLVLFEHARGEFKSDWYWSSNTYAGDAGYAWFQHFYHGYQRLSTKSASLGARAVRRVPIR